MLLNMKNMMNDVVGVACWERGAGRGGGGTTVRPYFMPLTTMPFTK